MGQADINDIKGIIPVGTSMLPWVLVGVAIGLVLAFAVWYFKFRKRPLPKPQPQLTPSAEARQGLQRLASYTLSDPDSIKRYHFELSEVARRYLERRYGVPATDRTWEEMQPLIPTLPLALDSQRQKLVEILKGTDLVKFTDYNPGADRSRAYLEMARQFVDETAESAEGQS